tara:strand:- start:131 stop:370 length:240 start_codon:yes stop_codon:yes gene_type:complete
MEELLHTVEINLLERENASYRIFLPSINWVNIILANVQAIGDMHLSKEEDISEDLVSIEFVVDSDDIDFPEEGFYNGTD